MQEVLDAEGVSLKLGCYRIVNCRSSEMKKHGYKDLKEWMTCPENVYIGRAVKNTDIKKSKWANPYSMRRYGKYWSSILYENYIRYNPTKMQDGHTLWESLDELHGKNLGCLCGNALKKSSQHVYCHGHVLIKLALQKWAFYGTEKIALYHTWRLLHNPLLGCMCGTIDCPYLYSYDYGYSNILPKEKFQLSLTSSAVQSILKEKIRGILQERFFIGGLKGEYFYDGERAIVNDVVWRFFEIHVGNIGDHPRMGFRCIDSNEFICIDPCYNVIVDLIHCRDINVNVYINSYGLHTYPQQLNEPLFTCQLRYYKCICRGHPFPRPLKDCGNTREFKTSVYGCIENDQFYFDISKSRLKLKNIEMLLLTCSDGKRLRIFSNNFLNRLYYDHQNDFKFMYFLLRYYFGSLTFPMFFRNLQKLGGENKK